MTIFGVSGITAGLPENDTRDQNRSLGQAQDGSWKCLKFGSSKKTIIIPLHNLSTTLKNSLITALEADSDAQGTITPDANIDLGNGVGTAITAQWIDPEFNFTKSNHDSWSGSLTFVYVA
jgi:hypothetical protein